MTFFFSSRRRHTRLQGDWSSDVCSSDLNLFWGQLVSFDEQLLHGSRIHNDVSGEAVDGADDLASPRCVPVQVCQIAPTGNNDRGSRQPTGRNSQQICPQVVRVDDMKLSTPEKKGQTHQLVHAIE